MREATKELIEYQIDTLKREIGELNYKLKDMNDSLLRRRRRLDELNADLIEGLEQSSGNQN